MLVVEQRIVIFAVGFFFVVAESKVTRHAIVGEIIWQRTSGCSISVFHIEMEYYRGVKGGLQEQG